MKKDNQEDRVFKGVWIPSELWVNKNLTLMEKVALVEINSYDKKFGCVATNSTLCKDIGINHKTFGNLIRSLESKGFLKISYSDMNCYSGRVISVVKTKFYGIDTAPLENQEPPLENQEPPLENQEPPLENQEHSNTFSNTFSKKEKSIKKNSFEEPSLKEVEDFLASKGYNSDYAKKIHEHYSLGNWKDSTGKPVVNWKQKINTNWLNKDGIDRYKIVEENLFNTNNVNEPKMVY